ncbi:MAG: hypothetical protein H6669_06465 [Ardenticatenaceae bacterium]|nr:hypothetical protein [Ardenticatenaceae bacterium]
MAAPMACSSQIGRRQRLITSPTSSSLTSARGGILADGYQGDKGDLLDFVRVRNRAVLGGSAERLFAQLPAQIHIHDLRQSCRQRCA